MGTDEATTLSLEDLDDYAVAVEVAHMSSSAELVAAAGLLITVANQYLELAAKLMKERRDEVVWYSH